MPDELTEEQKIKLVISIANDALLLAGEERLAAISQIIGTSIDAYNQMSGVPFDMSTLPTFKKIT